MRCIDVQVMIVGGGGTGLAAAKFLADYGITTLLIERHSGTAHLPKAHFLHQRSMEIFRIHGVADAIYAKGAPRENSGKITFHTSLGGDGPLDRKFLFALDIMGGGGLRGQYDLHGTTHPVHIPQILLEPVLREFAERSNPERVLFGHELVSFEQDAAGVRALILNTESGEQIAVAARFMIAADGGKTVGPKLGINMVGQSRIADYVSAHFRADFSQYLQDDVAVMRAIISPRPPQERPSMGSMARAFLLAFGPDRWDRKNREWSVAWAYGFDDPQRFEEHDIVPRIQRLLKVDVPIELLRVNHWTLESVIAERFRVGCIFLAGDAAHKHTPAGGLGLNSGIQDAYNLSWKIALVLKGHAAPSILDTFDVERRAIVSQNAEVSVLGTGNQSITLAALGVRPEAPYDYNEAQLQLLLAETPDGERRRARMREVVAINRMDYAAQDNDIGFNYRAGAIIDDGSPPAVRDIFGSVYTPSTRPGCRLPHVWLQKRGERVSTHDLVPTGGFGILTGEQGYAWCAAAQRISAETGLLASAWRIGTDGHDVDAVDTSQRWRSLREIDDAGVIVVRPDGHVAFRAMSAVPDSHAILRAAFNQLLGRSLA